MIKIKLVLIRDPPTTMLELGHDVQNCRRVVDGLTTGS